jgi:hypothetical protein
MPRRSLPTVLPTVLLAALAAPSLAGERGGSVLDSLPGDTTMVVRLRNGADLSKKLRSDHPELRKLADAIRQKAAKELEETRKNLGFDPLEIPGMVEGEVVLALGGLDWFGKAMMAEMEGEEFKMDPEDFPILLVVDAGASAPRLRETLVKVLDYAQKEGARKEVVDFQGGKITILEEKAKEEGGSGDGGKPDPVKLYFGEQGTRFFASVHRPFLQAAMAAPGPDALTKGPEYADTVREVEADADIVVFLNYKAIAASLRKNLQANPIASMVWNMIDGKLVGRSLKSAAVSATFTGREIRSAAFVSNGGAPEGLLGVLKASPCPGKPSPLIPEEADDFESVSLNFQALYGLVEEIYKTVLQAQGGMAGGEGGAMPDMDGVLSERFNVKPKELVASLGNLLHIYQKTSPKPEDPPVFSVALELKDDRPIKDLMVKVAEMGGLQAQKYLDRDLYTHQMAGADVSFSVGITDRYLVLGMPTDSVKEVLRRAGKEGKSIADTPHYGLLGGKVPTQVNGLTYSGPRYYQSTFKKLAAAMGGGEGDEKLPDVSWMGEMVSGSIGYFLWKDNGLYARSDIVLKGEGKTE